MRGIAAAILLLVVAGCATQAQRDETRMSEAIKLSRDEVRACLVRAEGSPEYQALHGKLPPSQSDISMERLVDATKPTPEDSQALLAFHSAYIGPCHKLAIESLGRAHPAFATVLARSYAEGDANYARLVQRQETWGEYAQHSKTLRAETRAALQATGRQIDQQLANAHAYEVQQRQAALSALSQWAYQQQVLAQQQQMINAMNRPVMTNCQYVGPTLNCTSF